MKGLISFLFLVLVSLWSIQILNGENFSSYERDMDSIIKVLKSQNIDHYLFSNRQGNKFLVVPEFGARILTVSVDGENLFWTHPDILKGQGGQRSWVSPEGGAKGFIFRLDWKENRDFSMLDPGSYRVVHLEENEHLILENRFSNTSNDGKENYDLTLTREMRHLADPLGDDPEWKAMDYQFLGIDFVHKLKNHSEKVLDKILDLWCLIQIPPKGTMIVPVHNVERQAWRGNYFEPIPEKYVKSNSDSFSFYIHGSQRYKVGIGPESAKGVIGYLSEAPRGEHFLVFMTFPVKPEARYVDRPKTEQETNGDAIQIYSHLEKEPYAFGEMECHSWGLDLQPDGEKAFAIKIHIYKASLEVLKTIGKSLVCSQFDKAYIFEEQP